MANICPQCNTSNRDGAGFCGGCGTRLGGPPSPAPVGPPAGQPPPPAPAPQGAAPPPPAYHSPLPAGATPIPPAAPASQPQTPAAVAAVGQAAKTAAKTAAQKSWEASKQGMGFLSRLMTGGGRAAYTELFKPVAIVEGYVMNQSQPAAVPAPLDGAAFLFAALLLFGWFLLLLDPVIVAAVLLVAWIGLLTLSWLGVRRPYFSRLTLTRLRSLLGDKSKGQVQLIRLTVNNHATGQPVDVIIIGPQAGPQLAQGHRVRVWGIPETDRNQVRAWQIEVVDSNGQSLGFLKADRLIPLTVALFAPVALLTLALLGRMLFGSSGMGAP